MVPLADETRRPQQFPGVTILLIALNVAVFLWEMAAGDKFVLRWSVTPAHITAGHEWVTLLTSLFLHASWPHLLGNMLFLWVFGPAIEDAMGRGRYLAFYLLGGVAANLAQIALSPHSTVVGLGASGAIAAVMGAFLVTYPQDEIRTALVFGIFVKVTPVRAVVLVGLWFVFQAISAAGVLGGGAAAPQGGTAYMAHVGGFLFGALFGRLFEDAGRVRAQAVNELNA